MPIRLMSLPQSGGAFSTIITRVFFYDRLDQFAEIFASSHFASHIYHHDGRDKYLRRKVPRVIIFVDFAY